MKLFTEKISRLVIIWFILFSCAIFQTDAFSTTFQVGPSKSYKRISDVPLDSLEPGDIVEIYYQERPYCEKIIIRRSGSKGRPIIIRGVPLNGNYPIIDGNSALQNQKEKWPQSGRWLVKVGDFTPGDYIQISNLELRNANNTQQFTREKQKDDYEDNAAGVFIRYGRNVLISNCLIHSCGNGIQTSYSPDVSNLTVSECFIYDNGNHRNPESSQEHNVYLCGTNTIVQFCRFGEPHSGHNIKERGLDTIIRYNWIEGGKNRQLDLVDHKAYKNANAYVYGNVIIQGRDPDNKNMINWGGDSVTSRSGTLYLFNNTIIANDKNTRFVVIRFPDCSIEMKNNAVIGSGILWNGDGRLSGSNNWLSLKVAVPAKLNIGKQGASAIFASANGIPYMPGTGSPLINAGTNALPKLVEYMPQPIGGCMPRPNDGILDIGAFETALPRK